MKTIIYILMLLALVVGVTATTTTLSDDNIKMDYYDTVNVEFCMANNDGPLDVNVVVDPVCRELNGLYGCQEDDDLNHTGFTVLPAELTTGEDGCVELVLTTDLEYDGQFYYTVNGQIGGTTIGSETGSVLVPEFGIIAALGILTIAGIYIYRKRD